MPNVELDEITQNFLLEIVEKTRSQPNMDKVKKAMDDSAVMCRKVGFALALCAIPLYITTYKKENGNDMPNHARLAEYMFNLIQSYDGTISNCESTEFKILCESAWKGLL